MFPENMCDLKNLQIDGLPYVLWTLQESIIWETSLLLYHPLSPLPLGNRWKNVAVANELKVSPPHKIWLRSKIWIETVNWGLKVKIEKSKKSKVFSIFSFLQIFKTFFKFSVFSKNSFKFYLLSQFSRCISSFHFFSNFQTFILFYLYIFKFTMSCF